MKPTKMRLDTEHDEDIKTKYKQAVKAIDDLYKIAMNLADELQTRTLEFESAEEQWERLDL